MTTDSGTTDSGTTDSGTTDSGTTDSTGTTDWTGQTLEVDVGAPGHGGFCVARHEGRVVFVRHALPGERVLARVTEDRGGSYCRADAIEIRTPAAGRVEPSCPVAGPGGCGGCDFQHATPETARALKAEVVAEQLRHIAGIDWHGEVEALPGGPLGWRTRFQLRSDPDGRAGFLAHRSHTVIPIEDCELAVPGATRQALARRWQPGVTIEVTADDEGDVVLREERPGKPRSGRTRPDKPVVQHALGRRWQLRPTSFWQVHPAAADLLGGLVAEWAAPPSGGRVWDLYGGVGLFAAATAEMVGPTGQVLVVESSKQAIADGRAALADLPAVKFVPGRVEQIIDRLRGEPDVVVLDPPRKGAGRDVAAGVTRRSPERIVHIGCDPAALARDVAAFVSGGYRLDKLRAFDLFPTTHHVECVGLLVKSDAPAE